MKLATVLLAAVLTSGCAGLLPKETTDRGSQWNTYEDARDTFMVWPRGKIMLGQTTTADLKEAGVDLDTFPNVRHLTYLDIAHKFGMIGMKPDNRITVPIGVLNLVKAGDRGRAYELDAQTLHKNREGSFILDWLNFRKNTHTTGWKFKVLIIVIDNKIEYVLHSGTPKVGTMTRERNPLGPLQSLGADDAVKAGVNLIK